MTSRDDGTTITVYHYDGYGRLVKTVEGPPADQRTTYRIPMGNEAAYEEIVEGDDTTKHKYISGNGRYLARVEKVNGGVEQVSYYHNDHLGSIRAVSNADVSTMTYDAYGNLIDSDGAVQDHDYRYTGKPYDSTGLYYYGARFYDPVLGRFINQDPARDGANWYSYTYNNPLKYVDPTGMVVEVDGNPGDKYNFLRLLQEATGYKLQYDNAVLKIVGERDANIGNAIAAEELLASINMKQTLTLTLTNETAYGLPDEWISKWQAKINTKCGTIMVYLQTLALQPLLTCLLSIIMLLNIIQI